MTINLLDFDQEKLAVFFAENGEKPFRAKQLLRWIHQFGENDFSRMSDLSKVLREKLGRLAVIEPPRLIQEQLSDDGTRKWLLDVGAGQGVETVFIPEGDRGTLCVSSQVGCALECSFCSTGRQGFNRNLSVAEIIGQLWWANKALGATADGGAGAPQTLTPTPLPKGEGNHCPPPLWGRVGERVGGDAALERDAAPGVRSPASLALADPPAGAPRPTLQGATPRNERVISNVVLMGMGEPLLNFDNTVTALHLMLDDNAYGLSRRRVTVSTSGIIPAMDRLREQCPVALAVSLHAPNDALRDVLVPINKKYPLRELMAACLRYVEDAPRDFITFEYVMLDGVNDTPAHARELIALVKDVPCKFNLIPFNPFPQSQYRRSPAETIRRFGGILIEAGRVVTTRRTRGDDIDAACGQLAGKVQDKTRRTINIEVAA